MTFLMWAVLIFSAHLLFLSTVSGQAIERGWKGILPLITPKSEVNARLGKPEIDRYGYHRYRTATAFVEVNYSVGPCTADDRGRGEFRVPEGTVLAYRVVLAESLELSKLDVSIANFVRDEGGDLANAVIYRNQDAGITIGVGTYPIKGPDGKYKEIEFVELLTYSPSKENRKVFSCEESRSKPDPRFP